jgi:hypothetical protein
LSGQAEAKARKGEGEAPNFLLLGDLRRFGLNVNNQSENVIF